MPSKSISPNHREILSARSTITGNQEYLTSTSGALNINGSFTVTGGATSANQTNGQQLVQIVDAGGEAATVTGGKLDVNATASLAGSPVPISGATTAVGVAIVDGSGNQITSFGGGTQYTSGGTPPANPIGPTLEFNNAGTWATVGSATPLPVAATFTPSGTQNVNLSQINGVTTAVGNGVAGTGVQRVTIASDNTAFPVNATLSAETTKVIGTVNQGTSPWVVSGTVTANAGTNLNTSALALETGGNLASIKTNTDNINLSIASTTSGQKGNLIFGAVTTAAPTYTTAQSNPLSLTTGGLLRVDGSGVTQPVSLASTTITGTVAVTQSTSPWVVSNGGTFAVQATLAAETTKVIGTVNQGTSPWVVSGTVTANAGTGNFTVAQATGTNLHTVLDSGTLTTLTTLTGTTTLTPGTGATNLGKAEDAAHTSGDVGVMALGVRNDNAATAMTSTNGDYGSESIDVNGTQFVRQAPSNTSALTTVASSATTVTILAANAARRNFWIYNSSTSDMYVKYGTTASSTSFTVYLPSLGTLQDEFYAGRIDGIWLSANGNAFVTEVSI